MLIRALLTMIVLGAFCADSAVDWEEEIEHPAHKVIGVGPVVADIDADGMSE